MLCACAAAPAAAHGPIHEQIADLSARIEQDPGNARLYLRRGELQDIHGDFEAALLDLDRAARLAPALAVVDLVRGKTLLRAGRPAPAKEALDRFLTGDPDHPEASATRARALVQIGDYRAATRDYTRAIAGWESPAPEYLLERARAFAALGDFEAAVRGLDEGMARLGPIVSLQLPAIDLELAGGRDEKALARVDAIVSRTKHPSPWLARRGEILERSGRNREAQSAYQAALAALGSARPTRASRELEAKVLAALVRLVAQEMKEAEP